MHRKSTSLSVGAFYKNFTAHHFHDTFRKGEPQAVSGRGVGSIALIKFIKNLRHGLFRHSGSRIFDRDVNMVNGPLTFDI